MTGLLSGKKRNWSPMVIGALAAAAVLLAAGVLMAVYQERLYSAQQAKSVREQAQILAASVTAAHLAVARANVRPSLDPVQLATLAAYAQGR